MAVALSGIIYVYAADAYIVKPGLLTWVKVLVGVCAVPFTTSLALIVERESFGVNLLNHTGVVILGNNTVYNVGGSNSKNIITSNITSSDSSSSSSSSSGGGV